MFKSQGLQDTTEKPTGLSAENKAEQEQAVTY